MRRAASSDDSGLPGGGQAPPKRILVVDDAVVIRKILTDLIGAEPGLEVAGTAPNGRIALAKIPQVNPDLVTLDVEMPEMDGLATLKELRRRYRDLPVIMFSTLTERGGQITMDALLSGANDYVTKPGSVAGLAEGVAAVREQLLPKIRALCGITAPVAAAPRVAPTPRRRPPAARVEVLAIGVSTGGPDALARLFSALPADLPVPVVVVQHMPPTFTRLLAERLDAVSPLSVAEARPGVPLLPGQAWIAAGGHHLVVQGSAGQSYLDFEDGPPENSCKPAVDVLFRSVARVYGPSALGVVLTGMGRDGLQGSRHLRAAGGTVVVQDAASSVVWGMPGAVADAGLADRVLPLDSMAAAISARARLGRRTALQALGGGVAG